MKSWQHSPQRRRIINRRRQQARHSNANSSYYRKAIIPGSQAATGTPDEYTREAALGGGQDHKLVPQLDLNDTDMSGPICLATQYTTPLERAKDTPSNRDSAESCLLDRRRSSIDTIMHSRHSTDAAGQARSRAEQLRQEVEDDHYHNTQDVDSIHSRERSPWTEYCERYANNGQLWAMTELAAWFLRRGDTNMALHWLSRVTRAQHETITKSSCKPSRPACPTSPHSNHCAEDELHMGRSDPSGGTGRLVRFDTHGPKLLLHPTTNQVAIMHNAAQQLRNGSLPLASAHRLIQNLSTDHIGARGTEGTLQDEYLMAREDFVAELRKATLSSWLSLSNSQPAALETYNLQQAPNSVLCAIYALAAEGLLDDHLFTAAAYAMRRWAKPLDQASQYLDTDAHAAEPAAASSGGELRDDTPRFLYTTEHWSVVYKPALWAVSWTARVSCDFKLLERTYTSSNGHLIPPFEEDKYPFGRGDRGARAHDLLYWLLRGHQRRSWFSKGASVSPNAERKQLNPTIRRDRCLSYGFAHRLDAPTSGPVLVANNYWGWAWLQLQFRARRVCKRYICLCYGKLLCRPGFKISLPLTKTLVHGRHGFRSVVQDGAAQAITEITAVAHLRGPKYARKKTSTGKLVFADVRSSSDEIDDVYSLVEIRLWTGRLHQIRVHMSSQGHALVSDPAYGGGQMGWCPRFFLHCFSLGLVADIEDPDRITVECQLPNDLRHALGQMQPLDHAAQNIFETFLSFSTADDKSVDTVSSSSSGSSEQDEPTSDPACTTLPIGGAKGWNEEPMARDFPRKLYDNVRILKREESVESPNIEPRKVASTRKCTGRSIGRVIVAASEDIAPARGFKAEQRDGRVRFCRNSETPWSLPYGLMDSGTDGVAIQLGALVHFAIAVVTFSDGATAMHACDIWPLEGAQLLRCLKGNCVEMA